PTSRRRGSPSGDSRDLLHQFGDGASPVDLEGRGAAVEGLAIGEDLRALLVRARPRARRAGLGPVRAGSRRPPVTGPRRRCPALPPRLRTETTPAPTATTERWRTPQGRSNTTASIERNARSPRSRRRSPASAPARVATSSSVSANGRERASASALPTVVLPLP